jgi:hypothetical protein
LAVSGEQIGGIVLSEFRRRHPINLHRDCRENGGANATADRRRSRLMAYPEATGFCPQANFRGLLGVPA